MGVGSNTYLKKLTFLHKDLSHLTHTLHLQRLCDLQTPEKGFKQATVKTLQGKSKKGNISVALNSPNCSKSLLQFKKQNTYNIIVL